MAVDQEEGGQVEQRSALTPPIERAAGDFSIEFACVPLCTQGRQSGRSIGALFRTSECRDLPRDLFHAMRALRAYDDHAGNHIVGRMVA